VKQEGTEQDACGKSSGPTAASEASADKFESLLADALWNGLLAVQATHQEYLQLTEDAHALLFAATAGQHADRFRELQGLIQACEEFGPGGDAGAGGTAQMTKWEQELRAIQCEFLGEPGR
jgi:hypothetical protein